MRPLYRDATDTAAALHDGLVLALELRALGIGPRALEGMLADGVFVRVQHGVYVDGAVWRAAGPDQRYRLRVRAGALVAPTPVVFSHLSAAAIHELPLIGRWPSEVHIARPGASGGSSSRHIVAHRGGPESESVVRHGVLVTSLARTVVDVVAHVPFATGVAIVDHVLRTEQHRILTEQPAGVVGDPTVTIDALLAELDAVAPRVGFRRAAAAIEFGSALSANAGESLSRARIFELGFVVPELQVSFPNVAGRDRWVDYYWRGIRKIGEFDGKQKYTRSRDLSGLDPAEVVYEEKLREDALRKYVNSFDRWTWDVALDARKFNRFLNERGVPRA